MNNQTNIRIEDVAFDTNEVAYISPKAVAKMCGVSVTAIRGLLAKLTSKLTLPEILQSFSGQDFIGKKLPENLVEKIVEYYAFDAGRNCTKIARNTYRQFSTSNFREFLFKQLNRPISTTQQQLDSSAYIIDREELIGLRTEGLLSIRIYVYFALRIDAFENEMQTINTQNFCTRWKIAETDYLIAIASLKKKGCLDLQFSDVSARAYSYQEKIHLMESQLNE